MNHKSVRITAIYSAMVFLILVLTMLLNILFTFCLLKIGIITNPSPELSILLFAMVSIVLGTILTPIVGKHPLKIIRDIDNATTEVVKGNFEVRLQENTPVQELRTMAQNFNAMVQELSNTEILRKDFIENVSHEFKTPLSAIEGYATLLQSNTLSEAKRTAYTNRILLNTRRLSNLTGNILLLSRLENQELSVKKELYSLDEQLREMILLFEAQWTEKQLDLDIDLCPIDYNGNKELLMQVWQNIFGNAIKFVPEHGQIQVLLSADNAQVKVSIADNGPGMREEVQQRIYEKFYQADSSRACTGNGLGLALAKRIVDLHNGTITVASTVGEGTTFTVTLPFEYCTNARKDKQGCCNHTATLFSLDFIFTLHNLRTCAISLVLSNRNIFIEHNLILAAVLRRIHSFVSPFQNTLPIFFRSVNNCGSNA